MAGSEGKQWHNWSGSVQCTPREIARPQSVDELARLVGDYGRAGRHVRVAGSGHSFTQLVHSDDALLVLDRLQGIEKIDRASNTVTVLGGTQLRYLGKMLYEAGLAQENLGDIDEQSISGAISTGTHGTGTRFGIIPTQVEALTLVTASGELLECSPVQNPDVFKAALVSLGALGVIAKVTLRVVPAKRLRYQVRRELLDTCLANLEEYRRENTHFEFFWLPYTKYVQAKFINETEDAVNAGGLWSAFNRVVMENGVFWLLSECCRLVPRLSRVVSNVAALGISPIDEVDYSHRVYATPRWVRFNEMEYLIPEEHTVAALSEIRDCIARHNFAVHFPVECRFVRADDIWLSPAYQRTSNCLAVHMYRGMPYVSFFQHIEKIFRRYQGRPHWGKMHSASPELLAELYPRWHDFRRVRASLDPDGVFLNDYLRQLLAADAPIPEATASAPETMIEAPATASDE